MLDRLTLRCAWCNALQPGCWCTLRKIARTLEEEKTAMEGNPYIQLTFQEGLPGRVGVNGCTVEQVIEAAVTRLSELNGRLPCRENERALAGLEEARAWLTLRTQRRELQGVEGTHEAHFDPFGVTVSADVSSPR